VPISGGKLSPSAGRARLSDRLETLESQPTGAGASILIVEDEAALATAVTDALRDAGYDVEHASDGEEALAKVQLATFDAVICDLKMPRLDGKAFYKALAAAAPVLASRVIFVTGDVAGTETEALLKQSACPWLAKPFRLGDLLRTVREVLA